MWTDQVGNNLVSFKTNILDKRKSKQSESECKNILFEENNWESCSKRLFLIQSKI